MDRRPFHWTRNISVTIICRLASFGSEGAIFDGFSTATTNSPNTKRIPLPRCLATFCGL